MGKAKIILEGLKKIRGRRKLPIKQKDKLPGSRAHSEKYRTLKRLDEEMDKLIKEKKRLEEDVSPYSLNPVVRRNLEGQRKDKVAMLQKRIKALATKSSRLEHFTKDPPIGFSPVVKKKKRNVPGGRKKK